jgi:hypothetical protein
MKNDAHMLVNPPRKGGPSAERTSRGGVDSSSGHTRRPVLYASRKKQKVPNAWGNT